LYGFVIFNNEQICLI